MALMKQSEELIDANDNDNDKTSTEILLKE